MGSENRTSENFPVIQDNLDFVFCQRSIINLDRDFLEGVSKGAIKEGASNSCSDTITWNEKILSHVSSTRAMKCVIIRVFHFGHRVSN